MHKTIVAILAAPVFLIAAVAEVAAQDVMMNSAETINKGNIKLAFFPTMLIGKNGGDSVWGWAGRAGFGLTSRFDLEGKVAIFKDLKYYGVEAEYWLLQGQNANVSVAVGAHMTDAGGGADSSGLDTSILFSTRPANQLELFGGLKFAFDSFKNSDLKYTLVHLVPGLECRLSADLDFLAEFGLALNDKSRNYVSVGLALYIR